MTNTKYLSPKGILDILCLLECRIPIEYKGDYEPLLENVPDTIEKLNDEVHRMMAFAGMYTYTPSCQWTELEDNVAAKIELKGLTSGVVNIHVKKCLKNDVNGLLAALAHEICHKRLEDSMLHQTLVYDQGVDSLERHTDLCTIYLGFGNLIIKGYNQNHRVLGYLDFQNYVDANNIVHLVRGNVVDAKAIDGTFDIFLESTLKTWLLASDKRKLLKETFKESEKDMAELHRNVSLCKQALDAVMLNENQRIKALYFKYYDDDMLGKNDGILQRPIKAFSAIYNCQVELEYDEKGRLRPIIEGLEDLLAVIDAKSNVAKASDLVCNAVECPSCGKTLAAGKATGKQGVMTCGNCKMMFLVNQQKLDLSSAQKRMSISDKSQTTAAAYQNGHDDGRRDGIAEERVRSQRELVKLDKDHAAALHLKYMEGMSAGQRTPREELLNELPSWLRWLVVRVSKKFALAV